VARNRITKRDIDALRCKPGQERAFLWDGEQHGFGVVGFKSGKKVFIAQYRVNGRSQRITIGTYGTMLLDDTKGPDKKPIFGARTLAQDILNAAKHGKDPLKARRDARAVRTFKEASEEFLRLHVAAKRKDRTHAEYEKLLELHIYPALGSRRLNDINRAHVARLHAKLSDTPYSANRCLALISSIWNWAARRDEVKAESNPAKGIERNPERGKERFLSPDELSSLGSALHRAETVGIPWMVDETKPTSKHVPKKNRIRVMDSHAVAAIRLLILTGARLREILTAKWDYVDHNRGILFLPDSKTGKKPIYLSAAALAVLNGIPRVKGNPFIIPGEKRPKKRGEPKPEAGPRADLKRPWAAISKAAGLIDVRIHDLRHSFASMGAGASLGLPIIGKLLGHTQAATTSRYAHLDADPLRRAAEIIGGQIAAAMSGKSADVLPLRPAQTKG
jgi:integrase